MLTQKDLNEIENLIKQILSDKIRFLPTKDEFFSKMDEIMQELKTIREEQTVIIGNKDQIEDHETRIGKIETVLQP